MPVQRSFLEYHKSIARELSATKDRIRQLIGDQHWLTDGEHKEAVIRKALRNHLPESLRVGRGFVCFREETSNQIDILITTHNKPTLFKDGELVLVTPDAVRAIIEVKTSLRNIKNQNNKSSLKNAINKLSKNIGDIRASGNPGCQAGLFVYEEPGRRNQISDKVILEELNSAANGQKTKAINWLAFGPDRFFRYWENGYEVRSQFDGATWHSYLLEEGLGHAYFLSNVVWEMSSLSERDIQEFYFPVRGGKELFRRGCISLENGQLRGF